MVNEGNCYAAIERGEFPGIWKRLHGMRGIPDYIVWVSPRLDVFKGPAFGRQFFVEVKELAEKPKSKTKMFELGLEAPQVPFFSKIGGWPGEKYVLVRWMNTRTWAWFTGEARYTSLSREIAGPFKRGRLD